MPNLSDYGFIPKMLPEGASGIPARVTAVHKERYDIVCEYGHTCARLKTSIFFNESHEIFPTTGDFVLISYNSSGDSQILKTLERKSLFSRRDPIPGRGEQVVAANFDYVFVMVSLNFDFNVRRIERYLTLSWQSGAIPVVILTKADLVEDFTEQVRAVERIAPGIDIIAVSAKTGYGMDELSDYLKPGKTIAFLGSSGVGKSSLVNALAQEEIMAVNSIREDDSKGRHTTTHRQLIMLPNGAMIIDTPGMRELGMWDVRIGIGEAFADVENFLGKCRFSDCEHRSEPGCAVKEAIARGELSEKRWKSYLQLKREAAYSENKTRLSQKKTTRSKSIAQRQKKKRENSGYEYE